MAKKAKWLENSTTQELLVIIGEGLAGDEKATKKAVKAVAEVQERLPEDDGQVVLSEVLDQIIAAAELAKVTYNAEAEMVEVSPDEDPVEEETEEDIEEDEVEEDEVEENLEDLSKKELVNMAAEISDMKKKELKAMKKAELIELIQAEDTEEDEDDIEDEDEDSIDYLEMTLKELKIEMKDRGLKVKKGMKKPEIIKILEADDEE